MLDQNRKAGTCFAGTLQSHNTAKGKSGTDRRQADNRGLFPEDEPLAGGEVQEGTKRDGQGAGHVVMDVQAADEEAHQGEVAEDGNGAVAGVKAQQAQGDIAGGADVGIGLALYADASSP